MCLYRITTTMTLRGCCENHQPVNPCWLLFRKGVCERIKALFFTRLLKGRKKKWYPTGRKKKSKEVLNHASMSVATLPHGDARLCLEGLSSLRPPSSHHWQSGHHGEFGLYHVSPGSGAWMRALGQMGLWWQAPCGGHPWGWPTQGPSATNVEPECPSLCPWKLPAPLPSSTPAT